MTVTLPLLVISIRRASFSLAVKSGNISLPVSIATRSGGCVAVPKYQPPATARTAAITRARSLVWFIAWLPSGRRPGTGAAASLDQGQNDRQYRQRGGDEDDVHDP